ncbi:hypothetical protein O0L34_g13407 [Tuta absoluta]|nr:hypothetical protein O0L34_g13407 [Tuta absoluta]
MAAVSSVHLENNIKIQETSDDEPYSPNTRDTSTPEFQDEKSQDRPIHTSSFSIHNVLKKERESNSPENVFSTDKLLQNTPNFDESLEHSRHSESVSPNIEDHDEQTSDLRAEISVDDENSCCSDDTVLSVGNEAPLSSFESNDKTQDLTQGLTSFKHIQTHLNAISQLSQNLNINQPLLLRPSPITPNPLMFLNQPLLFQNPLMGQDLKSGINIPNRLPIPQNTLNLNPQPFGLNFGVRKSQTQDLRNTRSDENRRLNYVAPKSQEESNYINQNCLKFSIDNILKADFGRRITDPLAKRKSLKTRQYEVKSPVKELAAKPDVVEARVPEVKPNEKAGAIDLSKGDDSSSNAGSTPGTTPSGDPMVWPAWVYCTRYSDRPSSGK